MIYVTAVDEIKDNRTVLRNLIPLCILLIKLASSRLHVWIFLLEYEISWDYKRWVTFHHHHPPSPNFTSIMKVIGASLSYSGRLALVAFVFFAAIVTAVPTTPRDGSYDLSKSI